MNNLERGARRTRHLATTLGSRGSPPANHRGVNAMDLESDSGESVDLNLQGGEVAEEEVQLAEEEFQGDYEEEEEEEEEEVTSAEESDIEDEDELPQAAVLTEPAAVGLKEISNLGRFTVSTQKQGNGVEQLRSEDLKMYWQSDGPQPHKLTVYFVKKVGIREIRFYVDYNEDESYTPTKITFKAGISENNLIEFAVMELSAPVGWQQVPVAGSGGGHDGNTLFAYVFQMQILENHQNGKDTHLRGIKIYALDAETGGTGGTSDRRLLGGSIPRDDVNGYSVDESDELLDSLEERFGHDLEDLEWRGDGLNIPDFMKEPELR